MHGPRGDIPYTLGGSDIATIFGVSPWTTPKELWRVKKGLMKPLPKDNGLQLELGHLLEPVAAKLYELKNQLTEYERLTDRLSESMDVRKVLAGNAFFCHSRKEQLHA